MSAGCWSRHCADYHKPVNVGYNDQFYLRYNADYDRREQHLGHYFHVQHFAVEYVG